MTEKVPKIIHYCWLSGSAYPPLVQECIDSWKKFCPDYELMLWDMKKFDIHSVKWVEQAVQQRKWAFAADYIRLYALYNYGGIYLDSDYELLKPLDPYLEHDGFVSSESKHSICMAMIAVKPKAAWIKEMLDEYENVDFIDSTGKMDIVPNSKKAQAYLERKYNYSWSSEKQVLGGEIVVYPEEVFSPLNCFTGVLNVTENTVGIHHYDNMWKSKKDKLKKKLMQIGTRVIGEENRHRLGVLKNKLLGRNKE